MPVKSMKVVRQNFVALVLLKSIGRRGRRKQDDAYLILL